MTKYELGDRWSKNFDYRGMLKAGMKAKVSDGPINLRKLFNSFEDVNYHSESAPLWNAIQQLEKGRTAVTKILQFNENCKRTYKRIYSK
jgi:hypothetical protein